jgi:hypothetical protein
VNGDGFEGTHFPDHAFSVQPTQGIPSSDRPTIGNLVEVARGAGGVCDRALAAHFVEAPALAVAFVAERSGEPARVKVGAPRAIFVNHALVGKLRTANLVEFAAACPW